MRENKMKTFQQYKRQCDNEKKIPQSLLRHSVKNIYSFLYPQKCALEKFIPDRTAVDKIKVSTGKKIF